MIKVEKDTVTVKGYKSEVLAELTMLLSDLMESGMKKEDIERAVELSGMTEEEIGAETEKAIKRLAGEFFESIFK